MVMDVFCPTLFYGTHLSTELRKAHAILYRPYEFLDHASSASEYPGSRRVFFIEGLIASGEFQEARQQSYELIKTTLSGLRYLETYDRTLIRTIVTFAYTGWIAFSAAFILAPSRPPPNSDGGLAPSWIPLVFGLAAAGSCGLFALQRLPWTLHVYILFPVYFWQDVTRKVYANWSALRGRRLDAKWIANTLFKMLLTVFALQCMVVRHFTSCLRYEILSAGLKSLDTPTERFGASVSSSLGSFGLWHIGLKAEGSSFWLGLHFASSQRCSRCFPWIPLRGYVPCKRPQ